MEEQELEEQLDVSLTDGIEEVEDTPQYCSEEEFDERLAALLEAFEKTSTFDEERTQQLHQLLIQPKEALELHSYIKLMYLQGKLYESIDNKNGARYCAMRLLWMKECLEKRRKRKPRFLLFHDYTFTPQEVMFLDTYTAFIKDIYKDINKKLLILTTILFAIAFALLAFALQANILIAFVEALILGILNYILQKKRMPDVFQKNQTDASGKYIGEDLKEFDRIYRF